MPAEFCWRKLKNWNSLEDPAMFDTVMLNGFFKGVGLGGCRLDSSGLGHVQVRGRMIL